MSGCCFKCQHARGLGPANAQRAKLWCRRYVQGKPLTKRQKAMLERQQQRRQGKAASQPSPQDSRDPFPKSSYAANLQPSPRSSVAVNQVWPPSLEEESKSGG